MPVTFEIARIAAPVETSLYASALTLGATDREVAALADAFAYDVDFQRDVRPGDDFELVFERFYDDEGNTVRTGDLLFVSLEFEPRSARVLSIHGAGRFTLRLVRRRRQERTALPDEDADQRRAFVVGLRHAPPSHPRLFTHAPRHRLCRADRHADPGGGRWHGCCGQGHLARTGTMCAFVTPMAMRRLTRTCRVSRAACVRARAFAKGK